MEETFMQKHYQHLKENSPYWPDNSTYFLTDSTFLHFPYFNKEEQKIIVLNQIKKIKTQLSIPISDYSIAINHFHIKFYLKNGVDMSKVKQLLRGGISFEYRKKYKMQYKEMWQTRKIVRIISQEMNYKISGYIIGNLLKHKRVSTFNELKENEFSSYWYMADKYGDGMARELVRGVININEDISGEVDLEELSEIKIKYPAG